MCKQQAQIYGYKSKNEYKNITVKIRFQFEATSCSLLFTKGFSNFFMRCLEDEDVISKLILENICC